MECDDFLEFQDFLKKMRDVDDKLVYSLNCTIPSPSFRGEVNLTSNCKELYETLQKSYNDREKAIRGCIDVTNNRVRKYRDAKNENPTAQKVFNKELTKLRLLKYELNVEEVVRDRSSKLYHERCRDFFKPTNLNAN